MIGLVLLGTMLLVGIFVGLPMYKLHFQKIDFLDGEKTLYISSGTDLESLGTQIGREGIVSKPVFMDFAKRLDFTNEKVEPGKYNISGEMKIKELIYALKNGNQEKKDITITFSFCKDIYEMASEVAPNIEADSSAIVDYIMDSSTLSHFGFSEETIPAMFFPDTYEIGEWDITAEEFVVFMAEQYKEFWDDDHRKSKLEELNLQQSEVSTLASIIEAEQGIVTDEWKKIAGLYLNRVKDNWKLQSDPTAKFCWGNELDGVQRLLDVHMERDCPYNTYIYAGLPPGPIRIPSKKAVDAVLNAEQHNYYFMCAAPNNSGLHNFAETYSQHLRNANAWYKYAREQKL
jgi:peptidoglycan lytic transglycosylase G